MLITQKKVMTFHWLTHQKSKLSTCIRAEVLSANFCEWSRFKIVKNVPWFGMQCWKLVRIPVYQEEKLFRIPAYHAEKLFRIPPYHAEKLFRIPAYYAEKLNRIQENHAEKLFRILVYQEGKFSIFHFTMQKYFSAFWDILHRKLFGVLVENPDPIVLLCFSSNLCKWNFL